MARVYLSERDRLCAKLAGWVRGQMEINRISQAKIAKELGISQQAFSKKLKEHRFTYEDYLVFIRLFEATQNELIWLIS